MGFAITERGVCSGCETAPVAWINGKKGKHLVFVLYVCSTCVRTSALESFMNDFPTSSEDIGVVVRNEGGITIYETYDHGNETLAQVARRMYGARRLRRTRTIINGF